MITFKQESTDDILQEIRSDFGKAFNKNAGYDSPGGYCYVEDTFLEDGYLIAKDTGDLYRVDFTEGDNGYEFTPKDQWKEVEQVYKIKEGRFIWKEVAMKTTLKAEKKAAPKKPAPNASVSRHRTTTISGGQPVPQQAAMPMQPKAEAKPKQATPAELLAMHILQMHKERSTSFLAEVLTQLKAYKVTGKLGTGSRFAKLKKTLGKKGVTNPGALAGYIGRKKFGAKKMGHLSAMGRKSG